MVDDWTYVAGAVSIGIGGDVSWDLALADRGINVYQYDHTVPYPPLSHPRFHFHPVGIGGSDDIKVQSLERIVADIPVAGDLVLKMDVEGAEWTAFSAAPSRVMERFSQIVVEVHDPLAGSCADRAHRLRVLRRLRRTHQVVHVHANNYAAVESFEGIVVPSVLEVTWLRRSRTPFVTSREPLPAVEDAPNDPLRPEIAMSAILAQLRRRP